MRIRWVPHGRRPDARLVAGLLPTLRTMDWEKQLSSSAGQRPWADDFPLDENLPDRLMLDCRAMRGEIHPMFALRIRTFADWHRGAGRQVDVRAPDDPETRALFDAMAIDSSAESQASDDSILPVTRVQEDLAVEEVAAQTREILEYQLTDVSALGHATFMAVSELCGNALEHGRNATGALVCVRRITEPRPIVAIAVSDLGMGIPEHIRQRYPEWSDDGFAIGRSMQAGISGIDDPHRGNGFSETFDAALTSALHAAYIEVHSASGFVKDRIVQESHKLDSFPPASFKRGTWISYELWSV